MDELLSMKRSGAFGGTMFLWMKSLEKYVTVYPVNSSSYQPVDLSKFLFLTYTRCCPNLRARDFSVSPMYCSWHFSHDRQYTTFCVWQSTEPWISWAYLLAVAFMALLGCTFFCETFYYSSIYCTYDFFPTYYIPLFPSFSFLSLLSPS